MVDLPTKHILDTDDADSTLVEPGLASLSLKAKALRGSIWTILGFGSSNFLRLAGNLVLTRLLFPEVFGLMALVQAVLFGLHLFSDTGVGPSIIQNKRGDDPAFLNTAWTIQVVRGAILWLGACLAAWPMARIYGQPLLAQLLPAMGLTVFISGFNSTNLMSANRHLVLGRLRLVELSCQASGLVILLISAWLYRSVWSLVIGAIAGTTLKLAASHLLMPGIRNRFCWDQDAWHELLHFGKWIFVSSVLTFFLTQGDRLLLGYYWTPSDLGVYTVAFFLASALLNMLSGLASSVWFPAFSRIKDDPFERIRSVYYRIRLLLDITTMGVGGFLMAAGSTIVSVLYDDRYIAAGWMLELLAVQLVLFPVVLLSGQCIMALGHTKVNALISFNKAIVIWVGIPLAYYYSGAQGIVWLIALSSMPNVIVVLIVKRRLNLLKWRYEIRGLPMIAVGYALGWLFVWCVPFILN